MFLVRTPLRISFLGGGTDHPDWFMKYGGACISVTIDKYIYLVVRRLPDIFPFRYRIIGKFAQEVDNASQITHPVIKDLLKNDTNFDKLEVIYWSDLPGRSGMGSSSAFVVGILNGCAALQDKAYTPDLLAKDATEFERTDLKEVVGNQDQIAAAYGGFNRINFLSLDPGKVVIERIVLPEGRKEELEKHIMLFYTGIQREASKIEATKLPYFEANKTRLEFIQQQVDAGHDMLRDAKRPIHEFGHFLSGHFMIKKNLSPLVSNDKIDEWHAMAVKAGATGGKLLGAGGGGFLLFIVKPEKQDNVRAALNELTEVKIKFSDQGSSIARLA